MKCEYCGADALLTYCKACKTVVSDDTAALIASAPDLAAENERLRDGILAVVNLPDGYAVSEIKEMLAALAKAAN